MKMLCKSIIVIWMLMGFMQVYAAEPNKAAKIEKISGKAYALSQTVLANEANKKNKRRLRKGSVVYEGERIQTAKHAFVVLRFTDNTMFALGAKSEMLIENYAFSEDGQNNSLFSRITKGSFRFISGFISKRNSAAMTVGLGTVATIGIRGTHVGGEVTPRDGDKDGAAEVMLLKPEVSGKKTAIEVFNEFGRVYIDQPGYGTDIPDEKSPPSPVRKMQIRTVNNILRAVRKASLPKAVR